jgi:hypothetical protein
MQVNMNVLGSLHASLTLHSLVLGDAVLGTQEWFFWLELAIRAVGDVRTCQLPRVSLANLKFPLVVSICHS